MSELTYEFEALLGHTQGLEAPRLSELVLQTAQYDAMRGWYRSVLGLPWSVDNMGDTGAPRARFADSPKQVRASDVRSCFMFLDRSLAHGQVLALFEIPELGRGPTVDPGLNHMQFRQGTLAALFHRMDLLMAHGLKAHRAANHGPMTSFYFCDPDRNVVEFCANNFDTPQAMQEFINSEAFRRNPSGRDFDPDALIGRLRAGKPFDDLLSLA